MQEKNVRPINVRKFEFSLCVLWRPIGEYLPGNTGECPGYF